MNARIALIPPPPTPQPHSEGTSSDRLAIPTIPPNPTQVERGRLVYYMICMPCHGDQGQGLTEEFRQVWVEDHQNCWARGCHSGRGEDKGFPLPRVIPAVKNLSDYHSIAELVAYLQRTHPPQSPGRLSVAEYRQVSLFLFEQPGIILSEEFRSEEIPRANDLKSMLIVGAVILVLAGLITWQARQSEAEVEDVFS